MIGMRAVDVVQPDVCYLGGLTRTLRVVAMAQAAGLPVTPHSANLSLVTVFTLHMMGAIAGAGPYVEFSIEGADYYPWQDGIFAPALVARDGKVAIPDGPGWGVEIKPALAGARGPPAERARLTMRRCRRVPRELVLFRHNIAGRVRIREDVSPEQEREDCND